MGSALNERELKLYRAVDEVLHYIWDPIGVAGMPNARDEYQGYLPEAFRLVMAGKDEQVIAVYLGSVVTGRMGLAGQPKRDLDAARALIEWRKAVVGGTSD